jgi:hypothetical protein
MVNDKSTAARQAPRRHLCMGFGPGCNQVKTKSRLDSTFCSCPKWPTLAVKPFARSLLRPALLSALAPRNFDLRSSCRVLRAHHTTLPRASSHPSRSPSRTPRSPSCTPRPPSRTPRPLRTPRSPRRALGFSSRLHIRSTRPASCPRYYTLHTRRVLRRRCDLRACPCRFRCASLRFPRSPIRARFAMLSVLDSAAIFPCTPRHLARTPRRCSPALTEHSVLAWDAYSCAHLHVAYTNGLSTASPCIFRPRATPLLPCLL